MTLIEKWEWDLAVASDLEVVQAWGHYRKGELSVAIGVVIMAELKKRGIWDG